MVPNQISMDFTTGSPINIAHLTGQNKRLFDHLLTGQTIHCMHPAMSSLRIGYLNSRISDLTNKHNIIIYKRFIKVRATDGGQIDVKEYSLKPFEK